MIYQAVLLDFGDTLLYFDGDWDAVESRAAGVLAQSLQDFGYPIDSGKFTGHYTAALEEYSRQRDTEFIEYTRARLIQDLLQKDGLVPLPEPALRRVLQETYSVAQAHWRLEEDALPVLEFLARSGRRLGLVTNTGDDEHVQTMVDRMGLRRWLEVVVTSAACGCRKPHPRIFQAALEALQVPPERVVMVGDMLGADILGARNAGLKSIWITRRTQDRTANASHEDTIHPDITIACLADLPCALVRLETGG